MRKVTHTGMLSTVKDCGNVRYVSREWRNEMAVWNVKVVVEYEYEVEADTYEQAEKQGWEYEEYYYTGTVDSIEVEEQDEPDEEDE
jgi:hypothetical protein